MQMVQYSAKADTGPCHLGTLTVIRSSKSMLDTKLSEVMISWNFWQSAPGNLMLDTLNDNLD